MSKEYFNLSRRASNGLDEYSVIRTNPNSRLLSKGRFRRGYLPLNLGDLQIRGGLSVKGGKTCRSNPLSLRAGTRGIERCPRIIGII